MNIRIDFIKKGPETVVRIAGRLAGNAVAELEKVCDPLKDSFVIDLSNLLFADNEGINAIRTMVDKGSRVDGASPFVQLLLDNASGWKTGDEESTPHNQFDRGTP